MICTTLYNIYTCIPWFHDLNGYWVPLELAFIASIIVTRMRMRCYGHMAHGTSPLYTLVRSLRDLHSLGPSALCCVNSVETCTSVYNLYMYNIHVVHTCTCTCMCQISRYTQGKPRSLPVVANYSLLCSMMSQSCCMS